MMDSHSSGIRFVRCAAILFCSLNVVISGMVTGWTSASLPHILTPTDAQAAFHETFVECFVIAIGPLFGRMVAAPFVHWMIEAQGPKVTQLATFYPNIISWILIALSRNWWVFFFARIVSGVSDALVFVSFPLYVESICDSKNKRPFYFLYTISHTAGILLINIIGDLLSISLAASIAVVMSLISFSVLLLMPESPYHLLSKNKHYQAKESLRFLRERDKIEDEYNLLKKEVAYHKKYTVNWAGVFKSKNFLITVVSYTTQQLTGIMAIVFFITTIYKDARVHFYYATKFGTISFALLLTMALLVTLLMDSKLDKFVLLWSIFGTTLALLANAVYFDVIDFENDSSWYSLVPIGAMELFMVAYGLALQSLPFLILNTHFSRNIKPKILGFVYSYVSVLGFIVCVLFFAVNDAVRVAIFFYVLCICSVVSFFVVLVVVPNFNGDFNEENRSLLDGEEAVEGGADYVLSSFEISDYSD